MPLVIVAKLINTIKAKESLLPIMSNAFMKVQTIIQNYNCQYLYCTALEGLVINSLNSFFFFINLFIYLFLLCWVFVSVRGLSLVAASGGHSSLQCAGLSLSRPLLLQSTGSRRAGSVVVAHGCSCSAACGIFPDQGSNPCPLHWPGRFLTTGPPGKTHLILTITSLDEVLKKM